MCKETSGKQKGGRNNIFTVCAVGISMNPILAANDVLYVRKVHTRTPIAVGDIVVFYQNNILISHRVIFKTPRRIYTKGDNVLPLDKAIDRQTIIGKVIGAQNKNVYRDFTTGKARFVTYYFLFYSIFSSLPAILWYKLFSRFSRGGRLLLRFLVKDIS